MNRIEQLRKIVADHQCAKIDGVLVDTFTASVILACYEAAAPNAKTIIETGSIEKVGAVSLRVMAKK